jgi:hypothetical protein
VRSFLNDDEHDDDVMVSEHTSNPPSCRYPIGIGKSTSCDAHDGNDDEMQRFSSMGWRPALGNWKVL